MVFRVKRLNHLVNVWMLQHFKDLHFFSEKLNILGFQCFLSYNLCRKIFPI